MNTITTTNESCPNEWDLLANTFNQNLYIYLTPIIIGIGLCGNILTILVFSRTDLQRQCVCVLTISLAIVDSLVLLIPALILWLETVLKREFSETSGFWCRTHGFFDLAFTCTSSWLIVFIAFDRFIAVWLPHNKTLFTHRRTFILVLSTILISAVISSCNFEHTNSSYSIALLSKTNSSSLLVDVNSIILSRCGIKHKVAYHIVGTLAIVINYFLPFLIIAVANTTIIYRLSLRGIVDITSNITLMLILVCIMHLVCTFPYQSWWLYYQVVQEKPTNCEWLKTKAKWRNFTFTIRNINYMLNFFLYSCSSRLFRDELIKLITICLFPSEQSNYPAYYYRRTSTYNNNTGQRFSISRLILRRLSRTTEYTNG
ncbi:unnamed protein product [Didymodactylos carnosus]|uniref:G-protein coupled receptors family 1 profile domain-containing protein n=1 Tax=Didymodactylos carnosus TaxID=1234261 RepID=A0A814RKU4_9BILA|nr:unnamed protein product [Didymodactylos carnosus]CAF1133555.1 unnamed protein product [Didymodactylos carnosus]CAF3702325.1 unnamed protein product [Didymodactylos carnosus]CAF3897293.1 unnamed protein product [Didymodactylos carnosus]